MLSFLTDVLSGELEMKYFVLEICVLIFVWAVCMPCHEAAHAWTADKLGDPTGRLKGRITLNPMAHLSPLGALLMLIVGVGYAKPVPVNIRNFKNRKLYFALTSLAGPVTNFLLAVVFALIGNLCYALCVKNGYDQTSACYAAYWFLDSVAYVNIALAVFNMIPIPPLDGSRLISMILPDRIYYKLLSYERYTMYILLGLVFLFNRLGFSPISIISEALFGLVNFITSLPFGLLI